MPCDAPTRRRTDGYGCRFCRRSTAVRQDVLPSPALAARRQSAAALIVRSDHAPLSLLLIRRTADLGDARATCLPSRPTAVCATVRSLSANTARTRSTRQVNFAGFYPGPVVSDPLSGPWRPRSLSVPSNTRPVLTFTVVPFGKRYADRTGVGGIQRCRSNPIFAQRPQSFSP